MHAGSIQVRLLGILAIGVICSLIACSGGSAATPAPAQGQSTWGAVVLELHPSSTEVLTGDSLSVGATVSGTTNTTLSWSVDGIPNGNATVGTITGSGTTITYTAPSTEGSHTLTVTSGADPTKSAIATVRVRSSSAAVSVALSPTATTLATGATQSFTASVANATNPAVSWTVDGVPAGDSAAGTISGTGSTVSYRAPGAPGSHVLVATSVADPTKSASSTITVEALPPTVGVTLSPTSASLSYSAIATFTATISGSTNTAVTWSVDGIANGDATVGTVTGTGTTVTYTAPSAAGSHTLVATSLADPSKTASSTISIQAPPPAVSVALSPGSTSLLTGGTASFTATVSGSTTTTVSWKVDGIANGNATVGTLTGTGNTVTYTAPATAGSHTLTATSLADGTKSATAAITVQAAPPPVSVSLSPGTSTLTTGGTVSLTATVSGTTNTAVTWTVDGIANGNASTGTLTGTGNARTYTAPGSAGSHTITATSAADTSKTTSATITVQAPPPPVSVTLSPSATTLTTGTSASFTATVSGSTTTTVTWMVDGVANGNTTVGTLSGTGSTVTYTAPASAGSHTLTATSVADGTKGASSAITVQAPPAPVSVALSPGSPTLTAGTTLSFTASVSGSTNTAVTWSVDGITNGNATTGTLTGAGSTVTYTAPSSAGTHAVAATSVADPTKSSISMVTVQAAAVPSGFIVAPNGVAGNPGTLAAPTTLEGARTLIQNASRANPGTLRVILRGGIYPRTSSFTMTAADSGSTVNPVEYVAYPNETPRVIGGVALSPTALRLVDGSDPNWSRLDPSARASIYVADLSPYASSLGSLTSRSDSGGIVNQAMEVFVDGAPLTLARYPKAVDVGSVNVAPQATIRVSGTLTPDVTGDYLYKGLDSHGRPYYQLSKGGDLWSIAGSATSADWRLSNRRDLGGTGTAATWGVWDTFAGPVGAFRPLSGATGTALLVPADGSNPVPGFLMISGTNGTTQITAPDSHMSRWRTSEAMYYGLGFYSWSGSHSSITSLDPANGTLVLPAAPTYGLRVGQPFFVYNLLEELTAPGEFFIDRVNARLYLRPIADVPPTEVLLSTLQTPILQMTGCQRVTWQGITFEAARDRLVYATSCQNVAFKNCRFRNTGGYGILLSGSSNLVEACDFRDLGKGGIWVSGGDRATLASSGTLIQNCEFQRFGRLFWTYQPAIKLGSISDYTYNADCYGITVQHNEIHDAPHAAILYSGSGNTIQYNHIYDAIQWTNDAGVIYTTGREWGTQGNKIQFNLIRNCGSPLGIYTSGIYIDGVGSGVDITGNILYRVSPFFAIQHNGGRDVKTQYNVFSGHWYGVDISNVGFEVVNNTAGSSWNLLDKLLHFNYQSGAWATAYPHVAAIPNTWAQLQGTHWIEPEGSVCYGNLQQGNSPDIYRQHNSAPALAPPVSWFSQVGGNLSQVDPLFTNPSALDFRLQPGSPMFGIPGFPGIDVSRIGIQR